MARYGRIRLRLGIDAEICPCLRRRCPACPAACYRARGIEISRDICQRGIVLDCGDRIAGRGKVIGWQAISA